MDAKEIKIVERSIEDLDRSIVELTSQKTEIEFRIEELQRVKANLTRLLPTDKRLGQLFK